VDVRYLIGAGLVFTATSLFQMADFTPQVDVWTVVHTGLIQGLGLGFVFVPLSTITFSTLPTRLRTEGSAMFSLMRNIGSSIGISVVVTMLAQNTQANHAAIAETMSPFRAMLHQPLLPRIWDWHSAGGAAALNGEITRQAATIAYLDDFTFMRWVAIVSAPLLLLLRSPHRRTAPAEEPVAAME
jgi:DHA2 family multidrug resistance protein